MAIRSGIAAQLGLAVESTYGTYVAATRFLEFDKETLNYDIKRIESNVIRANSRVLRSDRWAAGSKQAKGTLALESANKGQALLYKHLLGAIAITTPMGGTLTRDHTATVGDPFGLSLTVQAGRPDVAGTVQPFSYLGCKLPALTLANTIDGILMLDLDVDAQDETTAQALVAATAPASTELHYFTGGTVTLAGSAFDVIDCTVKVEVPYATDRRFIRSTTPQLKKEPIVNDLVKITGEMTVEWGTNGLTDYNRFVNGTLATFVANWDGATVIEASFKSGVNVSIPVCRFDGDTPNVQGPDVLTHKLPFVGLYDGSQEPVSIRYRTTDTVS